MHLIVQLSKTFLKAKIEYWYHGYNAGYTTLGALIKKSLKLLKRKSPT